MPASSVSLQDFVNNAKSFGDIAPVLRAGGFEAEPATTAMNDAVNGFFADYPYKFNEINLPFFYTNSYQQDYALVNPDGSSVTNLAWLEQGIAVNINATSIGKPWTWVQVGRSQIQTTANLGSGLAANAIAPIYAASFFPNFRLYYGTWGGSTSSLGNDPVANSVYTNPLGAGSMPANPITQIKDANGNLLVLTTYGHEGSAAPLAAVGALPGTTVSGSGATTQWTVVDPQGQGIRITPVPSQTGTVWQFRLVGQGIPPRYVTTKPMASQTIAPVTDEYEPHLRALFIAQLYRYSSEAKIRAKFPTEWKIAMDSLAKARQKSDRERDFYRIIPARNVKGGDGSGLPSYVGPWWPYGGPPR